MKEEEILLPGLGYFPWNNRLLVITYCRSSFQVRRLKFCDVIQVLNPSLRPINSVLSEFTAKVVVFTLCRI